MSEDRSVVLVVEDEEDLADLFSMWLSDTYEVRTAYDAEEALELTDGDVDVVLLDRRLPGMSGDEYLESIRSQSYGCPVAVISAVEPDLDILEMGFNDYVVKPISKEDIRELVERLLTLEEAGPETQEYFSMVSKIRTLEEKKSDAELARSDEYVRLLNSVDEFRNRVVSLAEDCLESPSGNGGHGEESVYREAVETWEERKKELDEDDPLYAAAEENIRKYTEMIGDGETTDTAEEELLRIVADSFVADDFWLDSRVLRALNQILYDKYDDTLVVSRQPLKESTELDSEKLFEVSEEVREEARRRIEGNGS
jgi:DNA-binding response OmpR family regulator